MQLKHLNRLAFQILPLLVVISLLVPTPIHSQNNTKENTISVTYKDTPLEQVLQDLESQTNLNFSYSSKTIPTSKLINYSAQGKNSSKIIEDIFKQAGIKYDIIGDYLVLSEAQYTYSEPKTKKPSRYTISGIITDALTNETLIGAAIYNKETGTGTLSNKYGFFSLTLPEGSYSLEISYLGYAISGKDFTLTANQNWSTKLLAVMSLVEEIRVTSFDKEEVVFTSLAAQNNIKSFEVEKKTAALGETDMLRSLGHLPGINFQNEGSSYFFVRGGNRDQNLILLDEAPIYNPSHFLGLFTPIIPEAVKQTSVYKGDFPIQYGGRLSSVIDVRTKDGNMQKFSGSGSIGLVATRLSFEGPIKKNSSSYFISYRRSHLGMFIKKNQPDIEDFYFSDFTTKFNFKVGQKDRLFLTIYKGTDKFINTSNTTSEGLEWGNTSVTLRWNHIYGKRLFSNTTFYTSKYDYFMYTSYADNVHWNSHISSSNLKSEYTYYLNPNNSIRFGVNLGAYFFNPGQYNDPNLSDDYKVSEINSSELVLYFGNEHKITDWMLFNYGLRLSNWSDIGEAFSIVYDENYAAIDYINYDKGERYYSSLNLEPRVSVSFKTGIYSSLKASYNRTLQHINLINNSISPFNSLEVWLPSGPNILPQHADIYNLGFSGSFFNAKIDFSADIYYKNLYNQLGYASHAETLLNPYLEGEIRQGMGKAYGYELLIKKSLGKLRGQIGYCFTRAKQKIDGLNNNIEYFSRQDKPVDLSVKIDYSIRPRWSVNLNVFYGSGLRYTTPTGYYYYRGTQIPIYSELNNDRLPDYKRVDLGTNIRLNKIIKKTEHYLSLNFYNFFATQNPTLLYFNKTIDVDDSLVVPTDKLNTAEQVAAYRYVYSIVPSFTYNLKF